jgi:benzodiazapine receptor
MDSVPSHESVKRPCQGSAQWVITPRLSSLHIKGVDALLAVMSDSIPFNNRPSYQPSALVGWLILSFSAAMGGFFVSIGEWYSRLNKPTWNPPSWVFGPAWTLLYLMMGVAAWLVWREGGWRAQRRALVLFLVQLVLNALWTPLFFGLHQPGLAFADIVLLWLTVALTAFVFWQVSRPAGLLLLPYLAWVTFAAVLNFTIWRMNP